MKQHCRAVDGGTQGPVPARSHPRRRTSVVGGFSSPQGRKRDVHPPAATSRKKYDYEHCSVKDDATANEAETQPGGTSRPVVQPAGFV